MKGQLKSIYPACEVNRDTDKAHEWTNEAFGLSTMYADTFICTMNHDCPMTWTTTMYDTIEQKKLDKSL